MKRLVTVVTLAILLVGLVLPGCAGDGDGDGDGIEFDQWITFAVAGPMHDMLGEAHWAGAEMARDEINDAGGVDVGGTIYGIKLVQVDTNEVAGTPAEGVTALEAVIGDVDFVVGGYMTVSVMAYREVAMDAQKIFMDCGAATGSLQYSVVDDYDTYKYWFKYSPYNKIFFAKSLFKMIVTIGGLLKDALVAMGTDVKDDYEVGEADKLRVAIIMENLTWADEMVAAAQSYLPFLGFNVVGTWRPSATATDITTELTAIAAEKPHIIFTAFGGHGGQVGLTYSKQRAELAIPAMSLGINQDGKSKGAWDATNQGCQYDIFLDTWAEGIAVTPKSIGWFNDYVAKTGEYPIVTAATYDAMNSLKIAIEATDFLDADDIITYLETHSYTGVGSTYTYYPMPDINLGGALYALSEEQVRALYDLDAYGWSYDQNEWKVASAASAGPHFAHDIVCGPGYQTGIGTQWQDGHKVGIWPMDLGDDYDEALTDQYGNWNFEYPGTVDIHIPTEWFAE